MINLQNLNSDSPTHHGDSPTHRVRESPTLHLTEFSFKHSKVELFFDYKYLHEFEAKIRTARKVVWGIYEEPISAKTPENPPRCHVPLNLHVKEPCKDTTESKCINFFILSYSTSACSVLTLFINPQAERLLFRKERRGKEGKRQEKKLR